MDIESRPHADVLRVVAAEPPGPSVSVNVTPNMVVSVPLEPTKRWARAYLICVRYNTIFATSSDVSKVEGLAALACVELPANTSEIPQSMITDLRQWK